MTYEIHPVCETFPELPRTQFELLKEDIRKHGILEPGLLFEGKVLDGRHRYRACLELDIEMVFGEVDESDSEFNPIDYVVSKNLHRRHLNETQRQTIAAKLSDMKSGTRTDLGTNGTTSINEASQLLNVKPRSTKRAKSAIKGGCKELVEAMERGEISSSLAAKFVKAVPDKKEQAKIIAKGIKAVQDSIPKKKSASMAKPQSEPTQEQVSVSQAVPMDVEELRVENWIRQFKTFQHKLVVLGKLFESLDDFTRTMALKSLDV